MTKKDLVEDLVKICIDSYNIILEGNFNAKMSDDVSNHLRLCLQIIDSCTIKEESQDAKED